MLPFEDNYEAGRAVMSRLYFCPKSYGGHQLRFASQVWTKMAWACRLLWILEDRIVERDTSSCDDYYSRVDERGMIDSRPPK